MMFGLLLVARQWLSVSRWLPPGAGHAHWDRRAQRWVPRDG